MPLLEAFGVAALVGALLYIVDRGTAFHACLYAAIASGGQFKAEQAYRALANSFVRIPRLLLWVAIIVASFLVARGGGISESWAAIVSVFVVALAYVALSSFYALVALRRTQYWPSRE